MLLAWLLFAAPSATPAPDNEETPEGVTSKTIDGVVFPGSVRLGDRNVAFRGAGTGKWLTFKIYTAALYATPDSEGDKNLLNGRPLVLILHYHHNVQKSDIVTSSEKTMKRNPGNDMETLRKPLSQFNQLLLPQVAKGDRYTLQLDPETGLTLFHNQRKLGTVNNLDFAKAYLGIWISEYPIQKKLKDKIIGTS